MKAMILAAGSGTRLRPLTERIPKCMVPVDGKPVLQHTIERLRHYGITDIAINLCYLPQPVIDHFGDGRRWGVRITYSIEGQALGTAGGTKKMAGFFDGPFLVWYGDNLCHCRLDQLAEYHAGRRALATIALFHRDDVSQSGIVGVDERGRVTRFLEKPTQDQVFSHRVNAGLYILEPEVLDWVPPAGPYDFGRDVFPRLLAAHQPVYGYLLGPDERLWWIDRPEDLARVHLTWKEATV